MAISVCIFAARCFSASHMPVKNCEPAQTSTGKLKTPSGGASMRCLHDTRSICATPKIYPRPRGSGARRYSIDTTFGGG
jgi:hypothetical protein